MDEMKLKALAAELAKGLKTEADINVFSRMLTKLTVETALNAALTVLPPQGVSLCRETLRWSVIPGFQKHRDARECLSALKQRLEKFGLNIPQEKTRLVRFGRFTQSHYREEQGKPGTFDFPQYRATGPAAR
jgi:hypothetical protein